MDRPRIKTKYPGVAYREKADGTKQYCIWFKGTDGRPRWMNVPGGERDAVRARAKIVNDIASGKKVAPSTILERSEMPKGDARRMNILDTDEIHLVLANANEIHRLLLRTAIFTGLRISELLALRWDDINWDDGLIHVRGTKTQAASRDVFLVAFLKQELAAKSLESDDELVFRNKATTVRHALASALKRAGVQKHVRLHDLRHTFASILIHQGHPDSFIAEQMGHSSSAFTRSTYGHMFDGKKQRERAQLMMQEAFGEVRS